VERAAVWHSTSAIWLWVSVCGPTTSRDIGAESDCEAIKRNALKDQGIAVAKLDEPQE
jgi:hypothetical protein